MSNNIEETNKIETDGVSVSNFDDNEKENQKKSKRRFLIYFSIIIVLTAFSLFLSLYNDLDGVINSLQKADWRYLGLIVGLVFFALAIEGFTIFVFSRLYSRNYKYHQGFCTSLIGAFYSGITPGSSGGQIMQVYTMKKQGVEPSSAASIMVMSFIVYQICLIFIGAIGLLFNASLLSNVGTFNINIGGNIIRIPSIPFTVAGFLLNISIILLLFFMSYSHTFHQFIINHGIGFLAKIKILKHPDENRESLRVQVENFKIELKRLCSNVPIFILMLICFTLVLLIRFSIPYFAGLALNGYGYCLNPDGSLVIKTLVDNAGNIIGQSPVNSIGQPDFASFWQAIFLSSYHQMATGLIPIPGSAGISEYFFNTIFSNYYCSQQVTTAAQILWRVSTYHIVILVCGIVAATYRSSPKNEIQHANRKSFVTLQYTTYSQRSLNVTNFETSSLTKEEIQNRLKDLDEKKRPTIHIKNFVGKKKEAKDCKPHKKTKTKDSNKEVNQNKKIDWDYIDTNEDTD